MTALSDFALPAAFALFVWWFSTGLILYLDGLPQRTFRWSLLGASVVLLLGLYGLGVSSAMVGVEGAYLAFASALAIWGWLEISFYLGYVTGPRKARCPENCAGWRHLGHAIMASLWHEIAILVAAAIVIATTWGQPNQIGLWTFVVLWWMHQSAKLNVLLGVRNLNAEFLPEHLEFLKSFLRKGSMNLLFPVSITVSTVIAVLLIQEAMAPGAGAFQRVGYTFLSTMMVLAIVEHWFLVLPLPFARLWNWYLNARRRTPRFEVEIVAGFLGSGKTTFLRRTLADSDPDVRTVALINDFSELGVDAALLSGRGAEVVELPNGCICCSLRGDLASQLQETIARYQPQRILIEPSGVADVASLMQVLEGADVAPMVKALRLYTMIDGGAFLRDYAAMPAYFEAQARLAPVFIVNKTDLISEGELHAIRDTLRALNPKAGILTARHGLVDAEAPYPATVVSAAAPTSTKPANTTVTNTALGARAPVMIDVNEGPSRGDHAGAAPQHGHGHDHRPDHGQNAGAGHPHHDPALGLSTWSTRLYGQCDPQSLRDVLTAIANGAFGDVARVKGIARAGAGWVHFDMAGGRASVAAFAPDANDEPRVIAIGRQVDGDRLQAAFDACATSVVGTC